MGPLHRSTFYRIVLDEAHKIRNHNTKSAKSCYSLRAVKRWCLTGTPVQNSLNDLLSLFKYLRWDYCDEARWKSLVASADTDVKKLQSLAVSRLFLY